MTDLKPCPFCGAASEIRSGSSTKPYVRCKSCGCRTGSYARGREADAVEAWNTRYERTCSMPPYDSGDNIMPDSGGGIIYHCSSCYHDLAIFGMNEDGDVWSAAPKYCPECGAKVEL